MRREQRPRCGDAGRTAADDEAEVMIFEPSEVINTGDAPTSDFTAPQGQTV